MAKHKSIAHAAGTPPGAAKRVSVVHLLGTRDEKDWLTSVHKKTHIPKTVIVRIALAEWASSNGHVEFPDRGGAAV